MVKPISQLDNEFVNLKEWYVDKSTIYIFSRINQIVKKISYPPPPSTPFIQFVEFQEFNEAVYETHF